MIIDNQLLFDTIFWALIIPICLHMNHTLLKLVIIGIGLIHAFYKDPWPVWTLMVAYPATMILCIQGYISDCKLAMVIGSIVFLAHYLKDSGAVDFYYFPS